MNLKQIKKKIERRLKKEKLPTGWTWVVKDVLVLPLAGGQNKLVVSVGVTNGHRDLSVLNAEAFKPSALFDAFLNVLLETQGDRWRNADAQIASWVRSGG